MTRADLAQAQATMGGTTDIKVGIKKCTNLEGNSMLPGWARAGFRTTFPRASRNKLSVSPSVKRPRRAVYCVDDRGSAARTARVPEDLWPARCFFLCTHALPKIAATPSCGV